MVGEYIYEYCWLFNIIENGSFSDFSFTFRVELRLSF